jgi:hypothetical protein
VVVVGGGWGIWCWSSSDDGGIWVGARRGEVLRVICAVLGERMCRRSDCE